MTNQYKYTIGNRYYVIEEIPIPVVMRDNLNANKIVEMFILLSDKEQAGLLCELDKILRESSKGIFRSTCSKRIHRVINRHY